MTRYRVQYSASAGVPGEEQSLEAPSIPMALLVAEINAPSGSAEIFEGDTRVARIERVGRNGLWRVT
jgi:hypothetical protein